MEKVTRVADLVKNRRYSDSAISFQNDVVDAYENEDWRRLLEIVDQYEVEPLPEFLSLQERVYERAHLVSLRSDAHLRLNEYLKVIEVAGEMAEELRYTRDANLTSSAYSMSFNTARAYYHLEGLCEVK